MTTLVKKEKTFSHFAAMRFVLGFAKDPLASLMRLTTVEQDIAYMQVFGSELFVVHNPNLAHEILVSKAESFVKWEVVKRSLAGFGEGLPLLDGEIWRKRRKIMQPAFHTQRIKAYFEGMCADTDELLQTWQHGQRVSIDDAMRELTLTISVKALFGAEISPADMQLVGESMATIQRLVAKRAALPFQIPKWWIGKENRQYHAAFAAISAIVGRMIQEKLEAEADGGDLLSALIHLTGENETLSPQELFSEVCNLFIAAHETTATTLTWAMIELAQNPEVYQRLQAEVLQLCGQARPTLEQLTQVPYLDAVIKETLRQYPPVYFIARQTREAVTIGNYALPTNSIVNVNAYAIQHDPTWYPEPMRFKPERFLEASAEKQKSLFLAFGDGQRICLGLHFALMEMKIALLRMIQAWSWELQSEIEVKAAGTIIPKNGAVVRVQKIN